MLAGRVILGIPTLWCSFFCWCGKSITHVHSLSLSLSLILEITVFYHSKLIVVVLFVKVKVFKIFCTIRIVESLDSLVHQACNVNIVNV